VNGLVVRGSDVLLVEFNDASGLHYNFPGGGVEVGETLKEALHREIDEETCLEVSIERLLLVESVGSRNTNLVNNRPKPWNEVRFFFLCSPLEHAVARLPDKPDANETGVRWFPLESLPDVKVLPQVSLQLLNSLKHSADVPLVVPNPHH
jgi:8-oxo-dGTP diphosphatase